MRKALVVLTLCLICLLGAIPVSAKDAKAESTKKTGNYKISSKSLNFDLNDNFVSKVQLTVKNLGKKDKITWQSSNEEVATVSSDGWVIPRSVGKCTITASIKNGNKVVASKKCKIKVEAWEKVYINGEMQKSKVMGYDKWTGEPVTLTDTVFPTQDWWKLITDKMSTYDGDEICSQYNVYNIGGPDYDLDGGGYDEIIVLESTVMTKAYNEKNFENYLKDFAEQIAERYNIDIEKTDPKYVICKGLPRQSKEDDKLWEDHKIYYEIDSSWSNTEGYGLIGTVMGYNGKTSFLYKIGWKEGRKITVAYQSFWTDILAMKKPEGYSGGFNYYETMLLDLLFDTKVNKAKKG